jgi:hypothetical protein
MPLGLGASILMRMPQFVGVPPFSFLRIASSCTTHSAGLAVSTDIKRAAFNALSSLSLTLLCVQAAVTDTRQTVSIARDRLALARRAVQNDESESGSEVMPNLLRAEDVAEEDEERVTSELKGEEKKLERDEEVAAEAPELAKVRKQTFSLCHAIFCLGPRACDLAQQS